MRTIVPALLCVLLQACTAAGEPDRATAAPAVAAVPAAPLLSGLLLAKRGQGESPPPAAAAIAAMSDADVVAAANAAADNDAGTDAAIAAAQQLEQVLARSPGDAAALTALARLAIHAGELDRAGEWVDAALARDPAHAPAHLQRAVLQVHAGQPDAAEAELQRAQSLGLHSPWTPVVAVDISIARGDFAGALAQCDVLVATAATPVPVLAAVQQRRIVLLQRRGDAAAVDAAWLALLALRPDDGAARSTYAHDQCAQRAHCLDAVALAREALADGGGDAARDALSLALYATWAHLVATQGATSTTARTALDDAREAAGVEVGVAMARYGGIVDNGALVQALLVRGVDIDARDPRDGYTALANAAMQGHDVAVRVLLTAGADPNFNTRTGEPPLTMALQSGQLAAVRMLLEAGAVPGSPGRMQHIAVEGGHAELAAWLQANYPEPARPAP